MCGCVPRSFVDVVVADMVADCEFKLCGGGGRRKLRQLDGQYVFALEKENVWWWWQSAKMILTWGARSHRMAPAAIGHPTPVVPGQVCTAT